MKLDPTRYDLAKKAALLVFCTVTFATIFKPLFASQPMFLTYIGIANSISSGIVYLLFRYAQPRQVYIYLEIAVGILFLLSLLVVSGGVHSQFSPVVPIIPVFVSLLVSARVATAVGIMLISAVMALHLFEHLLPFKDTFIQGSEMGHARTFWLCMACVVSVFFGGQFDRLSTSLGRRLQHQATIDPLTHLLNRRCILDQLKSLLDEYDDVPEWVSVMMVDVDNFKALNDRYGHMFGDNCLIAIAKALKHSVRNDLDYIGRYGGEEFLIVLDGVDQSNTHRVAEKVRVAVEELELAIGSEIISPTVTVGYCCLPAKDIIDVNHVVSLANEALSIGKKTSRNCVVGAEEGQLTTAVVEG